MNQWHGNWQDTQLLTLLCDYCFLYCRIFNINNIAFGELIVVVIVVVVAIYCCCLYCWRISGEIGHSTARPAKKLLAKIQSIFRK